MRGLGLIRGGLANYKHPIHMPRRRVAEARDIATTGSVAKKVPIPAEAQATFGLLEKEFEALSIRWDLQRDMFRSGDATDEEAFSWGGHAWHHLNRGLVDSMFITIGRMMDPATTGKKKDPKENISLANLLGKIAPGRRKAKIIAKVAAARSEYEAKIMPWRHWVLAHADMEAAKNRNKLPNMPFSEFDEVVETLLSVAQDLHLMIRGSDCDYRFSILYRDGGRAIVDTMRRGVQGRAQDIEARKKELDEKYGPLGDC